MEGPLAGLEFVGRGAGSLVGCVVEKPRLSLLPPIKLTITGSARSELAEREGALAGLEVVGRGAGSLVGSIVDPKDVGAHPTVGAKLGSLDDALAGGETSGTSAAGRLVGDSLDAIMVVVNGTAGRVVFEKGISSNTGIFDG
jgi:hypothetical protein